MAKRVDPKPSLKKASLERILKKPSPERIVKKVVSKPPMEMKKTFKAGKRVSSSSDEWNSVVMKAPKPAKLT